ncbi:Cell division control protein 14, partial [Leucoagaricus sp. SymC.cos]
LCSPRTSLDVKSRALERLEKQIAASCLTADKKDESRKSWDHFLALQYTFECNVPSRFLTWISLSTTRLEQAVSKGTPDERILTSQLAKALCIIQGIVLSHNASKEFLSRKYSLEILLELLLASRHSSSPSEEDRSSSARKKQPTDVPLTSTVLDTLLCILVDSPSALRAFESAHGVQAVVKILKRAGTPREVRMKCLEFLYFYLLDETGAPETASQSHSPPTSPISSVSNAVSYPGTPSLQQSRARLPKPSLNPTPLRPLSRHGSGSSVVSSPSPSSRSTSGSSSQSSTSVSSLSTPESSIPSTPDKPIRFQQAPSSFKPPIHTPQSTLRLRAARSERNPMMMLKREVDYEPLSPRKSVLGERLNTPSRPRAHTHGQFYTPSRSSTLSSRLSLSISESDFLTSGEHTYWGNEKRKTTDEKKQFLGTMLGNVDALVEGVRKAGIWGLG